MGAVAQEFKAVFTTPRVGQILFDLVAGKLDSLATLTYEADATARLRDEARSRVHDVYDTYSRGDVLVEAGRTIGEEQLILLRLEHEAAMGELTFGDRAQRALGILRSGRRPLFPGGILRSSAASRGSSKIIAASP